MLQEREYTSIGSNEKVSLDIRVICATNKDLKLLVSENKFREDLYFRINVVGINIPPLRKRKQDLPLLFKYFIEKFNNELDRKIKGLSGEAEKMLVDYPYPGNVRELSNIIESSMVLSNKDKIGVEDLPEEVINYKRVRDDLPQLEIDDLVGLPLAEVEKKVIYANLLQNNGHRKNTALVLGISEKSIRNKIKEYNIEL